METGLLGDRDDWPPEPLPQPAGQRSGRGGRGFGPPTAVGTDEPRREFPRRKCQELLLVNRSSVDWMVGLPSGPIERIHGRHEQVARAERMGCVLLAPADPVGEYAARAADLSAATWGIEITPYGVARPLDRRPHGSSALSAATSIAELNLIVGVESELKRLGITTVAEAVHAPLEVVEAQVRYPLLVLFDLISQLEGVELP